MISVETVVAERFPAFVSNTPRVRKPILAVLRYLFHEPEFKRFEQIYPHLCGFDFVEQALDYFDFSYSVSDREKLRIPAYGRVVIISNHPIGSLDGLALLKMVGEVRRDVKVVANDVLNSLPPLRSLLLPVDNLGNKTAKQNLQGIEQHLNSDAAVVIFPAGEVSRFGPKGLRDGRWRNGFLRFARKTRSPILPVFVDGRNSAFFYSLSLLAKPISTLWLVREMFKQANRTVRVRIGRPVEFESYDSLPLDMQATVKLFKKHVYKIGRNSEVRGLGSEQEAIAHPEPRQLLRDEVRACELLGATRDGMEIYLYRYRSDSALMREMGRLREISFRAVGEGSGKRRDCDRYDSYYDHILLWDDSQLEIVGSYRLVRFSAIAGTAQPLYSQTLFNYNEGARAYLENGVELGRSFVQPRYWGKRSLDYLWYGIGAYIKRFPDVRYLFGPVSISNSFPSLAKDLLVSFYRTRFTPVTAWASAKMPYRERTGQLPDFSQGDYNAAFTDLKARMGAMGQSVPTLYKQYTELCEEGGVQFVDFNIDQDFGDCIDGLVMVDLHTLKPSRRKRYLGE